MANIFGDKSKTLTDNQINALKAYSTRMFEVGIFPMQRAIKKLDEDRQKSHHRIETEFTEAMEKLNAKKNSNPAQITSADYMAERETLLSTYKTNMENYHTTDLQNHLNTREAILKNMFEVLQGRVLDTKINAEGKHEPSRLNPDGTVPFMALTPENAYYGTPAGTGAPHFQNPTGIPRPESADEKWAAQFFFKHMQTKFAQFEKMIIGSEPHQTHRTTLGTTNRLTYPRQNQLFDQANGATEEMIIPDELMLDMGQFDRMLDLVSGSPVSFGEVGTEMMALNDMSATTSTTVNDLGAEIGANGKLTGVKGETHTSSQFKNLNKDQRTNLAKIREAYKFESQEFSNMFLKKFGLATSTTEFQNFTKTIEGVSIELSALGILDYVRGELPEDDAQSFLLELGKDGHKTDPVTAAISKMMHLSAEQRGIAVMDKLAKSLDSSGLSAQFETQQKAIITNAHTIQDSYNSDAETLHTQYSAGTITKDDYLNQSKALRDKFSQDTETLINDNNGKFWCQNVVRHLSKVRNRVGREADSNNPETNRHRIGEIYKEGKIDNSGSVVGTKLCPSIEITDQISPRGESLYTVLETYAAGQVQLNTASYILNKSFNGVEIEKYIATEDLLDPNRMKEMGVKVDSNLMKERGAPYRASDIAKQGAPTRNKAWKGVVSFLREIIGNFFSTVQSMGMTMKHRIGSENRADYNAIKKHITDQMGQFVDYREQDEEQEIHRTPPFDGYSHADAVKNAPAVGQGPKVRAPELKDRSSQALNLDMLSLSNLVSVAGIQSEIEFLKSKEASTSGLSDDERIENIKRAQGYLGFFKEKQGDIKDLKNDVVMANPEQTATGNYRDVELMKPNYYGADSKYAFRMKNIISIPAGLSEKDIGMDQSPAGEIMREKFLQDPNSATNGTLAKFKDQNQLADESTMEKLHVQIENGIEKYGDANFFKNLIVPIEYPKGHPKAGKNINEDNPILRGDIFNAIGAEFKKSLESIFDETRGLKPVTDPAFQKFISDFGNLRQQAAEAIRNREKGQDKNKYLED